MGDELQRQLASTNDEAGLYEKKMTAAGEWITSLRQSGKDLIAGFIYSEEYRASGEYRNFNYKYPRNIDEPIWHNDIDEDDFPTIHKRLGENSCIVHFDDKVFDVRLTDHDNEGN